MFRHKDYAPNRALPLKGYHDTAIDYLKRKHPLASEAQIKAFVEDLIKKKAQTPIAEVLLHPIPGKTERKKIPLLKHAIKNLGQNIITPSGSVYMLPTKKESFIKKTLTDKLNDRKVFKKKMLNALAVGDAIEAATYHFLQASTKIFINSAPGAMNSPYNCLYDLPGYNAITSTARQSVKYGYAQTERLIEGNLYLPTYEDVCSYCLNLVRVMPQSAGSIFQTYGIYSPSAKDVATFFMESLRYYTSATKIETLISLFSTFSDAERAFVFYAGCLKNLVRFNDEKFRAYFADLFRTDMPIDPKSDPKDALSFNGDMLSMITSLNYEVLGYQPIDPEKPNDPPKRNELYDAIKNNPDGARKITAIGNHVEHCLHQMSPLFILLFRLDADIGRLHAHPNMMRRCVIISDTDSVIFSTQSMVEWYSGGVSFDKPSYEINAFTVFLLSQTLEHTFARLSTGFGMIGDDIDKIVMKNEFLYPIMMRTGIAKHYAGITTVQEGKLLPKPKTDIKGVQFRSSTLSSDTIKAAERFLVDDILLAVMKHGKIKTHDLLMKVGNFEQSVYQSLLEGDRKYLQTIPVKPGDEYDDPDRTQHFYYELWEKVFVPKFESIVLPNKCYKIPLRRDGKVLMEKPFLDALKAFDRETFERMETYLSELTKNKLSYLIIPPTMSLVPEILRPLIDYRAIIYQNTHPFYLALESLGFGYCYNPNGRPSTLISDYFDLGPDRKAIPL